ncbi:hypothetical protein LZ554_003387 [Drepanopeziza brunnea f. sp. 'monogermtubi']|nr:hypothetical protein LZ554_003387 [Drepanopeziza brunnea f. sp. 'monogermtubi']
MPLSKSICAILLAFIFFFNQGDATRIVIGYRTVSPVEAGLINSGNNPTRDTSYDHGPDDPFQLGNGLYLTQIPGAWAAEDDDWYCVIKADEEMLDQINKAWIPRVHWFRGEEEVVHYIRRLPARDPEKALRFSYIWASEDLLQMLIPTNVVNNDELDLWGKCFETKAELEAYSSHNIDWEAWNLRGDPGAREEPVYLDSDADADEYSEDEDSEDEE